MSGESFFPTGATQTIAASTASAGGAMNTPENGGAIRIRNAAAADGFYRTGVGAQTATAADIPFAANSVEVFRKPMSHTHIAVILASGTGNVFVTVGEGQ